MFVWLAFRDQMDSDSRISTRFQTQFWVAHQALCQANIMSDILWAAK
uniref:Uncharacterized protein n=1 Tax=Rhizophora mucronata TaxID=61149 RepID=A0A2P2IH41_RHIMU